MICLLLVFLQKNLFFILGVAHNDPHFANWAEIAIFRGFNTNLNLRATGLQLKLLILIESPNISQEVSKKKESGCGLLGKIWAKLVQCCEKLVKIMKNYEKLVKIYIKICTSK